MRGAEYTRCCAAPLPPPKTNVPKIRQQVRYKKLNDSKLNTRERLVGRCGAERDPLETRFAPTFQGQGSGRSRLGWLSLVQAAARRRRPGPALCAQDDSRPWRARPPSTPPGASSALGEGVSPPPPASPDHAHLRRARSWFRTLRARCPLGDRI